MAHDRQVEKQSDTNEAKKQSKTFSDMVADWLSVYGKVYREEVSEELVLAFSEALKGVRPVGLLHRAFLRAMKNSPDFRPTPGKVLEAVQIEAQETFGNRPKYLDEAKPSTEEREAALTEPAYQELRRKLRQQV